MPEKHFYFAVGATVGAGICVVIANKRHSLRKTSRFFQWLYCKDPHWFLYFPAIIFCVSLWGLIPDIVHLFGWLPKTVTRTAIFDVFFFHSTFEYIENTNVILDRYLNLIGEILLLLIALSVMLYYVFQVRLALLSSRVSQKDHE
jgi:hypothetical protein